MVIIAFFTGILIGAIVGIFAVALAAASKRGDDTDDE